MKKLCLLIVAFACWLTSYGQSSLSEADQEQIRSAVGKYVRYPVEPLRQLETGTALLKVIKENETIRVESLYASSNGFNFERGENHKYLLNYLGERLSNLPIDNIEVIIPLHFSIRNETSIKPPQEKEVHHLEEVLRSLKLENWVVLEAISITGFPPMRQK